MLNKPLIIIYSLIVLALNFIWMPVYIGGWREVIHPFYYKPEQGITIPEYFDFIGRCLSYIFISVVVTIHSEKYKYHLTIISYLWFLYLIDFILTYNDPVKFGAIFGLTVPLSYSMYMATGLLIWLVVELYKSKRYV